MQSRLGGAVKEPTYTGISKLVAAGAQLGEIEAYIAARTGGLDEDELSAAWLRDWLAMERPELRPAPGLEPLG